LRNRTIGVSKPNIFESCSTAEYAVKQDVIFGVDILK
jgi:hypothetical protein